MKMYFREFSAFFFSIIFPTLILLLFGTVYGNQPNPMWSQGTEFEVGYVDTFVPSLMYLVILTSGIMALPIGIAEYREGKILKRYKATPISPFYLLAAHAINLLVLTLLGTILVFVIGKVVYDVQIFGSFIAIILSFLLALIMTYSLGLLIASLVKSSRSANAIANVLYFPFMFLSGTMIPLAIFPNTLQKLTNLIPAKHAITLLQATWVGKPMGDYVLEILIIICVTIISLVVSVVCFKWE